MCLIKNTITETCLSDLLCKIFIFLLLLMPFLIPLVATTPPSLPVRGLGGGVEDFQIFKVVEVEVF